MKKWLVLALCIFLVISVTACSQRNDVKESITLQSQSEIERISESDGNSAVDSDESNEPAMKPTSNSEDEIPSPEPEQSGPSEIKFVDIYDNFSLDSENNLYVIQNVGELGPKHMLLLDNVSHLVEQENDSRSPDIQTEDGRFLEIEYGNSSWEIYECKTDFKKNYTLVKGNVLMDGQGNYFYVEWEWDDDGTLIAFENKLLNLGLNSSNVNDVCAISSQYIFYLENGGTLYLMTFDSVRPISPHIKKVHVANFTHSSATPTVLALTDDNQLKYYHSYEFEPFGELQTIDGVADIYPNMSNPAIKMLDGSYIEFYSIVYETYTTPNFEIPDSYSAQAKIAMPDAIVGARDEYGYPATMKCMVILTTDRRIAVLLPSR